MENQGATSGTGSNSNSLSLGESAKFDDLQSPTFLGDKEINPNIKRRIWGEDEGKNVVATSIGMNGINNSFSFSSPMTTITTNVVNTNEKSLQQVTEENTAVPCATNAIELANLPVVPPIFVRSTTEITVATIEDNLPISPHSRNPVTQLEIVNLIDSPSRSNSSAPNRSREEAPNAQRKRSKKNEDLFFNYDSLENSSDGNNLNNNGHRKSQKLESPQPGNATCFADNYLAHSLTSNVFNHFCSR
jgi:hypothetical protein